MRAQPILLPHVRSRPIRWTSWSTVSPPCRCGPQQRQQRLVCVGRTPGAFMPMIQSHLAALPTMIDSAVQAPGTVDST
jgi:hypothetical protein